MYIRTLNRINCILNDDFSLMYYSYTLFYFCINEEERLFYLSNLVCYCRFEMCGVLGGFVTFNNTHNKYIKSDRMLNFVQQ